MKTIIHIGQHKTGTTSIQKFLQENREALSEGGLYVPTDIAGIDDPSHFLLNIYSLAEGRFSPKKEKILSRQGRGYLDNLKDQLKKDIPGIYKDAQRNDCEAVIWSNEGLYLLNSVVEYKKLISLFSEYSEEIEVVCCFRDVESYRDSYKSQLKQMGLVFSSDPDSYRYIERDSWLFNYARKKQLLFESFDSRTYFPYNSEDNVRQFMRSIGFDVDIDLKVYRLNTTRKNQLLLWKKKFLRLFYQ